MTICHELARFVRGEPLYDAELLTKWIAYEKKLPADSAG